LPTVTAAGATTATTKQHPKLLLAFFYQFVDLGNLRTVIWRPLPAAVITSISAAPRAAVVIRHKNYPFAHRVVAYTLIGEICRKFNPS
jgi:hypothetical protein